MGEHVGGHRRYHANWDEFQAALKLLQVPFIIFSTAGKPELYIDVAHEHADAILTALRAFQVRRFRAIQLPVTIRYRIGKGRFGLKREHYIVIHHAG